MKSSLKLISILLLCLMVQFVYAQRTIPPISHCSNPNGGNAAHFAVRYFLQNPIAESARIETGATSETIEQIRAVADETICSALNQIVLNTPKYKTVDDNLNAKRTKYFYRTNNLYYIFWERKPEYDEIPYMGPKTLFIVVSADYQNIWEYYF